MKIKAEVIRVETNCGALLVTMRGTSTRASQWQRLGSQVIEVPDHIQSRRAFYVGRMVTLEVIL